jgi:hypothetical protein
LVKAIAPVPITPEKVVDVLRLPVVSVGVPLELLIIPAPCKSPDVIEKLTSCSVPETVKPPVFVTLATNVTVCALEITTLFAEPGTTPPTQVLPAFQLPVAFEVIVCPNNVVELNSRKKRPKMLNKRILA